MTWIAICASFGVALAWIKMRRSRKARMDGHSH
jgi:hypothetical protein